MPADPTTNFTRLAGCYAAARPSYPSIAIAAIVDGLSSTCRVADIGCGTGISSRLLAEHAAQVVGVEPNVDMLRTAQAASKHDSTIRLVRGTAEVTTLDAGDFDAVTCFQSFHWFDARRALAEFRRLLRRPGRLALVWNVRDPDADEMTRAYQDIVDRAQADAHRRGLAVRGDRSFRFDARPAADDFAPVRRLQFANPHRLTLDALLLRAASASYYPREGPLRDEMDHELRRLFERHEDRGVITLTQRTEVTLAEPS